MKFLVMSGANINMIGIREPEHYGHDKLEDLEQYMREFAAEQGVEVEFFASNYEGALMDAIHASRNTYDGIIFNPGGLCHYSYSIMDAIKAVTVPVVEVHIRKLAGREPYRISVTAEACAACVQGMGLYGYRAAMLYLMELIKGGKTNPDKGK